MGYDNTFNSITHHKTPLRVLVQHLLDNVDGLREAYPNFNKNTVHRLMNPPRKGTIASKRYPLINARPYRLENKGHKYGKLVCCKNLLHSYSHFLVALVFRDGQVLL